MNNNDVVLINLISSLMERDYFYVIEKGKIFCFVFYLFYPSYRNNHRCYSNYFINNGKPFL